MSFRIHTGCGRKTAAAAATFATAALIVLASLSTANAACTPPAAGVGNPPPGSTVTCSGATTDQNGTSGYGTGDEGGIIINVVSGATLTGSAVHGIRVGDATVNNSGAITGALNGVAAEIGAVTVTNSGSIVGTANYAVSGLDVTVINNFGASLTGGSRAVRANQGSAVVTNFGSISGVETAVFGIVSATVTNGVGASIIGGDFGVTAMGIVNVTNAGSITATTAAAIEGGVAIVTNNAGGTILGAENGIRAGAGSATVTNSGSITGTLFDGVRGETDVTVTNNSGGTIAGGFNGIVSVTGSVTVVNSGTISGMTFDGVAAMTSANVTNNAGATISSGGLGILGNSNSSIFNAGTIYGGVVAIALNGSNSSIFNAGTINGDFGAIAFSGSGNTLTLAPTSVITGDVVGTGADTFQLGGTGPGTFNIASLSNAAQYQGFGTFNKVGNSVWTLTGTSTFAGPVNVNSGTLSVNGNFASASAVTVNAGGVLGGNGTVGSTTINGGTLAPGNSIGLLTVQGNLVLTAAASYMVEVSPANADRTNVTGVATLGGATVNASFAAGTYVARQYTIVNATGGVSGTFSSLVNTNLPPGFNSSLSYNGNNAYLNIELTQAQYSGLSINQRNVANALTNFFNTTGGIPLVFGSLTPAGLTQVSGELATGSQQTTFDAMTQFMGLMTDPFIGGRGDGVGSSTGAVSFADEDAGASVHAANGERRSGSERDARALMTSGMTTKAVPHAPTFEQRWSVWGAGFGGSQTTDGNATLGSNTATSRIGGVAVGADYRFSPYTLAGFALAGGGTNFSLVNGLGSGHSDLFQAGAFVRHSAGAAYISGALAYGWQDITTDRTVTIAGIDRLTARFNANAFSGRVEGGYRFVVPWMGTGLTPYAAGQFTTFDLPDYAESVVSGSNTFAVNYASKSVTASRSELGIRTDKSWVMRDAILTLRGRAAWAHDFNPDRSIAATFQTLPGASFVVNGAANARDAALTTASAEMKFVSGISLAASFEGEFSGVTRSYAGKGVARYAW
jgi:uncharacterized protein with beta-barrel porin domain